MTPLTVGLVILGAALVLATAAALALVTLREARAVSRRQAQCGAEGLIGHVGVVRRPLDPLGQVAVDGELWRARRSWADEDEPPPARGRAGRGRQRARTDAARASRRGMGGGAMTVVLVVLAVLVAVLRPLAASSVRVLREYERGGGVPARPADR